MLSSSDPILSQYLVDVPPPCPWRFADRVHIAIVLCTSLTVLFGPYDDHVLLQIERFAAVVGVSGPVIVPWSCSCPTVYNSLSSIATVVPRPSTTLTPPAPLFQACRNISSRPVLKSVLLSLTYHIITTIMQFNFFLLAFMASSVMAAPMAVPAGKPINHKFHLS